MKDNKKTTCDPCEENFERKVNQLVKEGKAPTAKARAEKAHEVKTAFGAGHPMAHTAKPAAKPAAKPTAKHPVMAGAAKAKK